MNKITVLLIEDDPMVSEVNRQFIERVPNFEVIASARNGRIGLEKIEQLSPQLVFIDMFMPEKNGLETLLEIRAKQYPIDVIAVTADNQIETITKCLRLGVVDYIIKPFTYERVERALLAYEQRLANFSETSALTQEGIDTILFHNTFTKSVSTVPDSDAVNELPKGFNKATLMKVLTYLKTSKGGVSADDVAANIGVARVTARRYLDFMEKQKLIKVEIQYGSIGRPINQYFIHD